MKTNELIELLRREVGTVESKNVVDTMRDEIIEKLRQLEDIKKILWEMWELSTERDEIQWDLTKILTEEK